MVLEKTLKSPFDRKEIKSVNLKGNQTWIFIRRADAEAEAPIVWPPDMKSQLIEKDSDVGKDWRQEEKGMREDEMASPTQWTWVWASSERWWGTGKPGVLQSMGSQRVGHDWATKQLIEAAFWTFNIHLNNKMIVVGLWMVWFPGTMLLINTDRNPHENGTIIISKGKLRFREV